MLRSLLALLLLATSAFAQAKFEYWPGATYDPAIPTMRKVVGYDTGDRVSWHANIVKYFDALAAAQPNRIKVFEYGKTWEGRRLIYAAIGSEANIRRLSELQANVRRLADPRKTNDAEAKRIMQTQPSFIWLAYGVHGNEISSSDAAIASAYHLLASKNDKMVDTIMANSVVFIDPAQNPDGRDRFVHSFEIGEGLEPDAHPQSAEHSEPWPGGRTNHYFFDMNRDWLAITQPETKGRVKSALDWYPQVFIDLHEMGTESSYYFAPEADPFNPLLAPFQKTSLDWFGKNNAKYFDQFGYSYFTREGYDAFYPGYGASWPSYYGGISMTYENGSTRGLVVKRSDDTTITYRETVRRHFITSISSAETAAVHRADILADFYKYRADGIKEGATDPVREYILPRKGDVTNVDKLAQLLTEHGIELRRAAAGFSNGGKQYPAGSYTISLSQPQRRMIHVFLDKDVSMGPKFIAEEEDRRKRRLRSEIYDVTAWSLPLQFNVDCIPAATVSEGRFEPLKPGPIPAGRYAGKAPVAYLIPYTSTGAARLLAGALRENLRVLSSDKKFTIKGVAYPAGTLILKVKENPEKIHAVLESLAASTGADVLSTDQSWTDEGPTFGSNNVTYIRKPKILLAWDNPAGAVAGNTRFVLERQFGYPVTVVRTQQIGGLDLAQFHVIILPEGGFGGGYGAVLGANGTRRLKEWTQAGGTLIGLGSALTYLADPATGLLAVTVENALSSDANALATGGAGRRAGGAAPGAAVPAASAAPPTTAGGPPSRTGGRAFTSDAELDHFIQPDSEAPTSLHGAIAKAKVDPEIWINAGVPESVNVLVSGRLFFTPIKIDRGVNAVSYTGPADVLASGYMWEDYKKQLAYKPFVIVQREGRGNVIGFTSDPTYRAYLDGLSLLFANAVFRGPAHQGGGRGGAEQEAEQH